MYRIYDEFPYVVGVKDDLPVLSSDCPADYYEQCRKKDEAWFLASGDHTYWNFTEDALKQSDK